jgi:hypothetical protein
MKETKDYSYLIEVDESKFSKKELREILDSEIKDAVKYYFREKTGSHAGESIVEEILEIIKTDSDYPKCNVSDIRIGVNNWLASIKEDDSVTIESRTMSKHFEEEDINNTCDHCGGEALFETENSSQTSGDICDICGDWVCQDCLDHSKCGVDYDNVCQKCSKELDRKEKFESILELAKKGLEEYKNAGDYCIGEIASSADTMAEAIEELIKLNE